MNSNYIVAWLPAQIDACALYRMFIPHLHCPNSRFVFDTTGNPLHEFSEAKVAVVQRMCTEPNRMALEDIKAHGIKLVFDLDDNLWAVPKWSPARKIFDVLRPGFAVCAEICDAVTVSTQPLVSAAWQELRGRFKGEIHVVPNAIDFQLFKRPPLPKPEAKVIIGWGGSGTHDMDVVECWEVLPEVMAEAEDRVVMEFVNMYPPQKLRSHLSVRMHKWVPVAEYMARFATWGWDIVLAPLEENRFNRSKSNIKALEAAALGAVCLMAPVTPYLNFVEHHPDLKYLICWSKLQWKTKILELVNDHARRQHLAATMRQVVEEHYLIEKVIGTWQKVFDSLVN